MFGSLGMPELIFILVLALLIFGPKRLPQVGRTLGRGLREFRQATNELKRTVETEISAVDVEPLRPTPAPLPQPRPETETETETEAEAETADETDATEEVVEEAVEQLAGGAAVAETVARKAPAAGASTDDASTD